MRFYRLRALLSAAFAVPFFVGCQSGPDFAIDYEKYQLDNGLEVVLHMDRSDPIAAVAVLYHVGSNREEVGRTGFAHLFEHMMFQSSQHVAEDQFFKKIQDAGGTLNGGTSSDQTIYFEVVPKNALEMALWLESDRLGYLLPTVTQEAFENQQSVVQNEKRQSYDNRPYGHTNYVIDKLLYPEGLVRSRTWSTPRSRTCATSSVGGTAPTMRPWLSLGISTSSRRKHGSTSTSVRFRRQVASRTPIHSP